MLKQKTKAYLLVLLLLIFSGNPLVSFYLGKYFAIVGLAIVVVLIHKNLKIGKFFYKTYNNHFKNSTISGLLNNIQSTTEIGFHISPCARRAICKCSAYHVINFYCCKIT